MTYFTDRTNTLPKHLRDLSEEFYDITGRPYPKTTYPIVVGRLCAMSKTYYEFLNNYKLFFNEPDLEKNYHQFAMAELAYSCYIQGISEAVKRVEQLRKKRG